jgi:hypothetical protein
MVIDILVKCIIHTNPNTIRLFCNINVCAKENELPAILLHTVIALAMALELNKKETDKLLSSAGFTLSESETFDLVIQFCLEKKIYDIHDVNHALDYFSLKPLVGVLE